MSPLTTYIVETVFTLLAIVVLAVLVLYGARKVGVGRPSGPLSLVGRLPLDGRRAVYLVKAGKKVLVVGASEAGLSKLGELDEAPELEPEASKSFSEVLGKVLRKPPADEPTDDVISTKAAVQAEINDETAS